VDTITVVKEVVRITPQAAIVTIFVITWELKIVAVMSHLTVNKVHQPWQALLCDSFSRSSYNSYTIIIIIIIISDEIYHNNIRAMHSIMQSLIPALLLMEDAVTSVF
jgi:hypothetical protein